MADGVDINRLAAAAKAGDADAQYKIAAVLSGEGHKDAAIKMLKQAAASGHLDARFTLANFTLIGHMVPRNLPHACQILEQASSKGHEASMRLLGVLKAMGHGTETDWPGAVSLLVKGAAAGHTSAMCELALLRAFYGFEDDLNRHLLMAAATRGHVVAMMHLVRSHVVGADTLDPATAKVWALQAQQAGHPIAPGFVAAVEAEPATQPLAPTDLPTIPDDMASDLATSPESAARPAAQTVLDRPHIEVVPSLISLQLCDHVIAQSAPSLAPARVVDPTSGELRPDPYRHSFNMTFWPADLDMVLHAIGARMAAAAGYGPDHGEMLSVLVYQQGMYYGPHFDCLVPDAEGNNPELERSGQRPKTVLVYLNDAYEGGETNFVRANFFHKGGIGDAIVFSNILEDGSVDEQSLHESKAITHGVKWIASKWLRENPYRF